MHAALGRQVRRLLVASLWLAWPLSAQAAPDPAGLWGPLTLLPPVVAVLLALITRKVEASLLTGAVVAALVARRGDPLGAAEALLGYLGAAVGLSQEGGACVFSPDHLYITLFSLLVAAMVGVVSRAGGTRALVGRMEGVARDARGAGVASWLAGGVVFFDDYANCLVVGNAMGPLADRFGMSRAKLAYIVDSTAAPVASLAVVSTWVGYEIGLIEDALASAGHDHSGLSIYLASIPFRFYAVFTLVFVGVMAWSTRDFGPMRAEELQAREAAARGELEPVEQSVQGSPWTAALPVATLVLLTLVALVVQGRRALGSAAADAALFEILGEANPYTAMLVGSGAGLVLAALLGLRALPLAELGAAAWSGVRSVAAALVVLFLAWVLGDAIADTGAASYITGLLGDRVAPQALPALTFGMAAGVAFATGTSWGTMGILFPLAVPLAVQLSGSADGPIALGTVGAILAGACFGDHSSPISDTTVLSALGAGVDVVTHVRTQLPYALVTGTMAIAIGYLPVGWGLSPWLLLPLGAAACVAFPFVLRIPPVPSASGGSPPGAGREDAGRQR